MLEANIQGALAKDAIQLEDAIDIREIKNIKLANQLLKYRRKKKMEYDQMVNERNIQAQSEANAQAAEATEMAKAKAEEMKVQSQSQLEEVKTDLDIKKLQMEANVKKDLMNHEFELNVRLKQMELGAQKEINSEKMEMEKKKIDSPPKSSEPKKGFESSGNDVLGGLDLAKFEPK